ncbi:general secretion pathway protein M [Phorcysia thermohydrogeniphila]|uniref:General secretion pathway protein M n=1 Tax=Phorcysia thermohydrogeniphila TaxID=936138 RepID=A0A4R1GAA2_9BACT|nr:general secretion pathway protein M [Phorcysia thermohydrogeniphila]
MKETFVDYLSGLNERDRLIVLIGTPVAIFLAFVTFVFSPISSLEREYLKRSQKLKERVEKLRPKALEFVSLKSEVEPALRRVRRGKNLNVADYVKKRAQTYSIEVKNVKVSVGRVQEGIEVKTVTVSFSEVSLNKLGRFIRSLESSPYYFKSTSLEISDMDENGLVSGKVTFNFMRSEEG